VLDCVASGAIWINMTALGVDVLISAPQKGWSASPSAGVVMMSDLAEERLANTQSNSFAIDLKKWRSIMQVYEGGGHAYHATMPTDALVGFRDAMLETRAMGFDKTKAAQWQLGQGVRAMLEAKGVVSVAAEGFGAPGVVVAFTQDPDLQNGKKFLAQGLQIAAGVPLQVGEGAEFRTFRIGLFGLDKLADVPATLARLQTAMDAVF
jgi:aspartate aminotransferase-like enzyme